MTILIISLLSGRLAEQRAEALVDHRKLRDKVPEAILPVPSRTDPGWSTGESNEVFVATVGVVKAIASFYGQSDNFLGSHDCTMRILGDARAYAAKSRLPARSIVAGLHDVAEVIARDKVDYPFDSSAEGWWVPHARMASTMLTVICRVYEAQLADEHMRSMQASPRKERGVATAKEAAEGFLKKWNDKLEGKGPVVIYEDRICVECRPEDPGPMWIVELAEIQNPTRLLKWVSDLTSKTWCTAEMVRDFVGMVCSAKGWPIYADPDSNPGTAAA